MISRRKKPGNRDSSHSQSRINKSSTDQVYFVQNENDVLKLKNFELEQQLKHLNEQCRREEAKCKDIVLDCDKIEQQLKRDQITPDILLSTHKHKLEEQLRILEAAYKSWEDKIAKCQLAHVQQEKLLPQLVGRKEEAEMDLWRVKMETEGMKVVVTKLEKEIEQLRKENEDLLKNRKNYGPEEQKILDEIELKIKEFKERFAIRQQSLKKMAAAAIFKHIYGIYQIKIAMAVLKVRKGAETITISRKKLFSCLHISNKYLRFIKAKTLFRMKSLLKPAEELQRMKNLFVNRRFFKTKGTMFAKWRKQFIKAQYSMIRKLEVFSIFDKIQKSLQNICLVKAFLILKGQRSTMKSPLESLSLNIMKIRSRLQYSALDALKRNKERQYLSQQLEESSKVQTEFLIKSLFFNAFSTYVRQLRPVKNKLLHKYFKALKKNHTNKKKRELQQIISIIVQKSNVNAILIKAFVAWKQVKILESREEAQDIIASLKEENSTLQRRITNFAQNETQQLRALALAKVFKVLLRKCKKAIQIWRNHNKKLSRFKQVLEMLQNKSHNDKNLGFAKIQSRRFQRLKVSIAQKIKSCQFSYNYLTEENAHIKQVLDRKTLDVEKTKFVKIIKNLINNQRQAMRKYFYKFLNRGKKAWIIKEKLRRLDGLVCQKIKKLLLFLLRQKMETEDAQNQKQHTIQLMQLRNDKKLARLTFQSFTENIRMNKKLKSLLSFLFNRNTQLKAHAAYVLVKSLFVKDKQQRQYAYLQGDVKKLKQTNEAIEKTENRVAYLTSRLKDRTQSMKERLIVALKLFFTKNIKKYVGHYLNRWQNKMKNQKRAMKFADTIERKLRIRLMIDGFKQVRHEYWANVNGQLQDKLDKFTKQLDGITQQFNNFSNKTDIQIEDMRRQSKSNIETAKEYKTRNRQLDVVRKYNMQRQYGKYFAKQLIRKWKIHLQKQRIVIGKLFNCLIRIGQKQLFPQLIEHMQHEVKINRIKHTLHRAMRDTYTFNTQYFFRVWRFQSQQSGQKHRNVELREIRQQLKEKQQRLEKRINGFQKSVESVVNLKRMRHIFGGLRHITKKKRQVKVKAEKLQSRLQTQWIQQFIHTLTRLTKNPLRYNEKIRNHNMKRDKKLQQLFLMTIRKDIRRRNIFEHSFLNTALHQLYYRYAVEFFSGIKKYHRYKQIYLKDDIAQKTLLMVETLDRKRKIVMGQSLRKWRKYEYIRMMKIQLMRRLTRKAMNKRIEMCFFTWKLESQARKVVDYHSSEGQVRKRERQYQRTKRYIQELKRKKGLLLENQQGDLVLSPRFLEKREQQKKLQNAVRYRLASRLLLVANGQYSTIKAWNNVRLYSIVRTKVRKAAQFSLNMMRHGAVYRAFRSWHTSVKDEKEMLQNMSREQLIKLLQKQKDRLQVEYSRKTSNENYMNGEIAKFQMLERRKDIKQRLCGCILTRFARNKKQSGFRRWRQVVLYEIQEEAALLVEKGDNRLITLEEQIRRLQQQYEYAVQTNRQLKSTALEGLEIAQAVRRLTIQRDQLNRELQEKDVTCQALFEQNVMLNNRFNLAHQQAFQLLSLTKN